MKRAIFLLASVALTGAFSRGESLTDTDRRQLLEHLYRTRLLLAASLNGLTTAQLKFKPADEKWSILECAEHLTLAEPFLMNRAEKGTASESGKKSGVTDANVLKGWGTVQNKVTAPPVLTPNGQWKTAEAVLKEFDQRRAKTILFVATTEEDLRGKLCCGGMDVYQQILGLSAHVERHVTQMNAVKADPKYPK